MQVAFVCSQCQRPVTLALAPGELAEQCPHCREPSGLLPLEVEGNMLQRCVVCGCKDLWRQKDFPQVFGLTLVVLGAVISIIAWAWYMPRTALGTLLAFALGDLLLYLFMKDVLVCYRCQARYRDANPGAGETIPYFNLETAERYRQEAARVEAARGPEHRT